VFLTNSRWTLAGSAEIGISDQRRIVCQVIELSAAETLGCQSIKDFILGRYYPFETGFDSSSSANRSKPPEIFRNAFAILRRAVGLIFSSAMS